MFMTIRCGDRGEWETYAVEYKIDGADYLYLPLDAAEALEYVREYAGTVEPVIFNDAACVCEVSK